MYDLKHGDRVPGSRWFRAYCPGCGEAMRVTQFDLKKPDRCWCGDCDPTSQQAAHTGLTPRQRAKLGKTS